jgi:hypothetical protein
MFKLDAMLIFRLGVQSYENTFCENGVLMFMLDAMLTFKLGAQSCENAFYTNNWYENGDTKTHSVLTTGTRMVLCKNFLGSEHATCCS